AALVTAESVKSLELGYGKKVWVSFKASAVKYAEE
ncbi:MAG: TOBE domain-containing protein, partial [Planctomycetota bacterium]